MINIIKWLREKPTLDLLLLGGSALLVLVSAGALITLILQDDQPKIVRQPAPAQAVAVAQVSITADGFVPATLSLKKGTKVVWTNGDEKPHQIYANPYPTGDSLPGLKSALLNNGLKYEYTATKVGTFGYHDKLNPTLNGTITVQE